MQLEEITLTLFAACNGVRFLAYVPQIHKAATDKNGASAISRTTWSLFLVANLSTIAYALVNRSDPMLALCFAGNAVCCLVILAIACWKGGDRGSSAHDQGSGDHSALLEPHPREPRHDWQVRDQYRSFSPAALTR